MTKTCPTPVTIAQKKLAVDIQLKENGQFLAIYLVIGGLLGVIIVYLFAKLISLIWRYKTREIATRKEKEKREQAIPGSISLLHNSNNDNEEYAADTADLADAADDLKEFSENIQRTVDATNREVRYAEDSIDKSAIMKQYDEY